MKKLIVGALLSAMTLPVFAQAQSPNFQSKPDNVQASDMDSYMNTLSVATQLAKIGYQTQSSYALVESVRLMAYVPEHALDAQKSVEQGTGVASGQHSSAVVYDPVQILIDAKSFADGDKSIIAMVDAVKKEYEDAQKSNSTRGRVGGPGHTYDKVLAYDTDVYTIRFRGGEKAEVIVDGDGDTDLDLYIYDENDNLIDSDADSTDYCYCSWYPKWTGNFKIKIKNRGSVYNSYKLTTN